MVALEIGAGVGDESEAGGMGFRETVEGERGDRLDDLFLHLAANSSLVHPTPQTLLDLSHALDRAFEAHRSAQLLGLAAREPGRRHRHAQDLLLKDRYTQRPLQNGLETGVWVGHFLAAEAALEIGVDHAADNRSRPDDGHLDDQVVEPLGTVPRQRGHLGTALDLKDPDGVGTAHHRVGGGIIGRQMGEIHSDPLVGADHRDRFLEGL